MMYNDPLRNNYDGPAVELGSVVRINHNLYVVTGITIENGTDVSFEVEALDNESK